MSDSESRITLRSLVYGNSYKSHTSQTLLVRYLEEALAEQHIYLGEILKRCKNEDSYEDGEVDMILQGIEEIRRDIQVIYEWLRQNPA